MRSLRKLYKKVKTALSMVTLPTEFMKLLAAVQRAGYISARTVLERKTSASSAILRRGIPHKVIALDADEVWDHLGHSTYIAYDYDVRGYAQISCSVCGVRLGNKARRPS